LIYGGNPAEESKRFDSVSSHHVLILLTPGTMRPIKNSSQGRTQSVDLFICTSLTRSRIVRRLVHWLQLRLLGWLPLHEIAVTVPVRVRVYLLAHAGGSMYEQLEFEISDETHPWLRNVQCVHMCIHAHFN
jgi:hypothetical protein